MYLHYCLNGDLYDRVNVYNVHVQCTYTYTCIKAGMKVGKKPLRLFQVKMNGVSKLCTCFYQCCSYLDWL